MRLLLILGEIIFLFGCVHCQIENGWKKIKVFETTRTEVEKILGKPKQDKIPVRYVTDEAIIDIDYSNKPCSDNYSGAYNIKQDNVFAYIVRLKDEIPLTELTWQKENYIRTPDPEVLSLVYYSSAKDGIKITAGISADNRSESVFNIEFRHTNEQDLKYKCKNN